MPSGLHWFLNSHQCLRKTGLAFFQDTTYSCPTVQTPTSCCSFCHPAAMSVKTTSMPQHRKNNGDTLYQPWRAQKLRLWREQKCKEIFPNSMFAVALLSAAITPGCPSPSFSFLLLPCPSRRNPTSAQPYPSLSECLPLPSLGRG